MNSLVLPIWPPMNQYKRWPHAYGCPCDLLGGEIHCIAFEILHIFMGHQLKRMLVLVAQHIVCGVYSKSKGIPYSTLNCSYNHVEGLFMMCFHHVQHQAIRMECHMATWPNYPFVFKSPRIRTYGTHTWSIMDAWPQQWCGWMYHDVTQYCNPPLQFILKPYIPINARVTCVIKINHKVNKS